MLHVTPQARIELHGMLMRALSQQPQPDSSSVGFRLVPGTKGDERGLGLALDQPREGDEVVEHEGHSVLIVDSSTSDLVKDLTLDVVETPDGTRLGIRE